ncbi:MAG TPA: ChaN family lipoprotein [Candidatus Limnocylindrales bacterium]|jgi:uncharacterized iron-regulated protein|nr:ChaN family lipoprotein [Candidatus Limnocylindrales bacterium]
MRARRRTAAQQLGLEQVQREIKATDPHVRLKYLREFSEAFRDYQHPLTAAELQQRMKRANVLLVGDYHALPACQSYTADLLEQLTLDGKPVVLAIEMVFSRDQHLLDRWLRDEMSDDELRSALRYDVEWGYEWKPFIDLVQRARRHSCAIYGIDCATRGNMRKIGKRDRHAAGQIAAIRRAHPEARVVVLFGEAHLAPTHLPLYLKTARPKDRVLTVLQNVDELYWRSAGESPDTVPAVQVNEDTVCVFNATPLEKYESYRIYIERWRQPEAEATQPALAPTFYNLVDTLLRSLGLEQYYPAAGNHPSTLVEEYPEVQWRGDEAEFAALMEQRNIVPAERGTALDKLRRNGCVYLPQKNLLLIERFNMWAAAEEAVRFVQTECRGARSLLGPWAAASPEHHFYFSVMEKALVTFGARVLNPHAPTTTDPHAGSLEKLGVSLGAAMHEAYLDGVLTRSHLRALFFRKIHLPGAAKKAYAEVAKKIVAHRALKN